MAAINTPYKQTNTRILIPFFCLAFGLTWGLGALLFLFPDSIISIFGEVSYTNPLFILAVYSPGIAGIFLVLKSHGIRGLGLFLRRLTLVRMPLSWWLFVAIGIPTLFYVSAAMKGSISEPFPFTPWYDVFPALAMALFIGPIEELGWRGVALPLLQRKLKPFWAALVLGAIWATWHLPSFFVSGTHQSNWSFIPFFVAVVALSVIITPMVNAARGSILVAILFHFQVNGPVWPDAQPWDALTFGIAAVIVVLLNRKTMFTRKSAVTEILAS